MKKNRNTLSLLAASIAVLPLIANAQVAAKRSPTDTLEQGRVAFAGYGDVTYNDPEGGNSAFTTKVVPIALVQLNDEIHIEAELELSVDEDGETEDELEYANVHYFLTDSSTITAGKFLLPFGQFGPNLHPSWINKLPSIPVIYGGHDGNGIATPLLPVLSDIGVAFQKTFVFGNGSRLFFDAYVVNGPEGGHEESEEDDHEEELDAIVDDHVDEEILDDHEEDLADGDDHEEDGPADDDHVDPLFPEVDLEGGSGDNNDDKAFGGRLAYAWLPEYEVGVSYYQGAYDDDGDLDFTAFGVDIAYVSTYFTMRGEYVETETEGFDDHGDINSYDRDGWYLQGSWFLKQTGIELLAPVEVVAQWSEVNEFDASERWAIGLNYWLTPSVPIKLSVDETELDTGEDQTRFIMQIAYGF